MKRVIIALATGLCLGWQSLVLADATNSNMIPELKDIEKIASEQEAAIRSQSDALLKTQKEKEVAEKAAMQAIEQQKTLKAAESPIQAVAQPATPDAAKPVKKKVATTKPAPAPAPAPKVDPWLAQERRYTFP